jgi:Ca-activated chloride channel homolog
MEIEGGEVGSGHSMVAVVEIVPTVRLSSALNFSRDLPVITKDIARLTVSYRLPADSLKRFSAYGVKYNYSPFHELPPSYKFASSVVMFGSLLKGSAYAKQITWNETIIAANEYSDKTDPAQKEFVQIIEKAKKIYSKKKKKLFN